MQDRRSRPGLLRAITFAAPLLLAPALAKGTPPPAPFVGDLQAATANSPAGPGVPFTADKLSSLLPATVYFQGRSAPLQLRNAAGTTFGPDQILWASLVDTSGYSTSVQERYQFFLVTEGPLRIGGTAVPAGAYGAGFVGDHFLLMDPGGHTIAQGPLQTDTGLRRPRPLQMVADQPSSIKLYLGRHWVLLQADPNGHRP